MKIRLPLRPAPLILALAAATLAVPLAAHADVPGLQIAPLQYNDTLKAGRVENGYIDVSNPGDSSVNITSGVQGFRQTGTNGDLQFFADNDLSAGIKVGLDHFTLGPREAVRVVFSVDPAKLPGGGVYAAIFFRTQPPDQTSSSSFVSESANVGTLLILTNGNSATRYGGISALRLPFWQFGSGITGDLSYHNTDHTSRPVGFKPGLSVRVFPWGRAPALTTGLVLPGVTRNLHLSRPGSYFGLLPILITDASTHHTTLAWVFACTGIYAGIVLWLFITGLIFAAYRTVRRQPLIPISFKKFIHRFSRHKPRPIKRPMDGLSPKS